MKVEINSLALSSINNHKNDNYFESKLTKSKNRRLAFTLANILDGGKASSQITFKNRDEMKNDHFISKDEMLKIKNDYNGTGEVPGGVYNENTDEIIINSDSPNLETNIVHEIIHRLTVNAINRNTPEAQKIKELFTFYKNKSKSDSYGFLNEKEFVAMVFSSPNFRNELSKIEAMDKSKFWDLLKQFAASVVEVIKEFFTGIEYQSNALHESLVHGLNLIKSEISIDGINDVDTTIKSAFDNEYQAAVPRERGNHKIARGVPVQGTLFAMSKEKGAKMVISDDGLENKLVVSDNHDDITRIMQQVALKADNQIEVTENGTQLEFNFLNNSNTIAGLSKVASEGVLSASAALKMISDISSPEVTKSPLYELISSLVTATGIDTSIVFLSDDAMRDKFMASSPSNQFQDSEFAANNSTLNGFFDEKENVIYINQNKAIKLTLFHELFHAATSKYLSISTSSAVNELRAIYSEISNMREFKGAHEVSTFDEFITGLYTSPNFVTDLVNSEAVNGKTLWEKIVRLISNVIGKITGKKYVDKSAINQIMNIANEVVSDAMMYKTNGTVKTLNSKENVNYSNVLGGVVSSASKENINTSVINGINKPEANKLNALLSYSNETGVNEDVLSLLAAQINSLPISKRFSNISVEKALQMKYGFIENNLNKQEQVLIDSALNLAHKKLSKLRSSKFNTIINEAIESPSALRLEASMSNEKILPSINRELTDKDFRDIAEEIERTSATRLKEFERKGFKSNANAERKAYNKISNKVDSQEYILAIMSFMDTMDMETKAISEEFKRIDERMHSEKEITSTKLSEYAKKLKNMENFADAFLPILKKIGLMMREHNSKLKESGKKIEYDVALEALYNSITRIDDVLVNISELNIEVVASFLNRFKGSYKGDIKSLLKENNDISWMKLFFYSMGESQNDLLTLTDYATKSYLETARLSSLGFKKNLEFAHQKLMDSGVTSTSFLYEMGEDGLPTGYFITERKVRQHELDRLAYYKDVNKEAGLSVPEKEQLMKEWSIQPENRLSSKKYDNRKAFEKALNTKEKREFYDTVLSLKKRLDSYLPKNLRHSLRAPQISQDITEYLTKLSKGEKTGKIQEQIGSMFVKMADDVDANPASAITAEENKYPQKIFVKQMNTSGIKQGEKSTTIPVDQNLNPSTGVPVHFVTMLKNGLLSTDAVQGMVAYADSVYKYHELNKILHILELERTILKTSTEIQKRDSFGNKLISSIKVGDKRYSVKINNGSESNLFKRLEGYIDMVYYGNLNDYGKDYKIPFTKDKHINFSKIADKFGLYVAVNSLALNLYAGIQNPIVAGANLRIEATGGEHFGHKALFGADKIIASEIGKDVSEKALMKRTQTSKLALWIEYMNTLQKGSYERSDINSSMKNPLLRMFKTSTLFFINNIGEYYIQSRLSIALALETKVKDANGKEINLWEAYEVKDKQLVLKKGVKKLDGSKFTQEDEKRFMIKQNHINNSLNGIYNATDKSIFQKNAIGRLVMMFRKFMIPGFSRRYASSHYDFSKDMEVEGYYTSAAILMKNIMYELKDNGMRTALSVAWKDLTPHQKRNFFRALNEIAFLLGAFALSIIVGKMKPDDDEEDHWLYYMTLYQIYRFMSEMGFFINPNETIRLMQSPAAAVTQVDNLTKLFSEVLSIDGWDTLIRSGKNKGLLKAENEIYNAIPMRRTIQSMGHPEDKLKFFTTD